MIVLDWNWNWSVLDQVAGGEEGGKRERERIMGSLDGKGKEKLLGNHPWRT